MAFCPHCGTNNPDDAKFCSGCGAPVVVQTPAAPPAEAPMAAAAAAIPEIPAVPEIPAEAAPEAPVSAPEVPVESAPEAPAAPELTFNAPQPTYTPPQPVYTQAQPVYTQAQPVYAAPQQSAPEPYATGGLLAWSIVSILLCLIPGIVALLNVLGINNCATVEEQQRKISSAKTWCIVATVLGGISVVYSLIRRMG